MDYLRNNALRDCFSGEDARQALEQIKVQVLTMPHEQDACCRCQPYKAPMNLKGMKNAQKSKGGHDSTCAESVLNQHAGKVATPCATLPALD